MEIDRLNREPGLSSSSPQRLLLFWASSSHPSPHTGSCGGTGSGRGHDGGPCRSTALLPSSGPGSGSGCCCCCSVRSSPPLGCSGPPLSPRCRPPPSSPRLPEESSRSAGRPAWPSPQRAAQRTGEAERLRAWPWGQLEGRRERQEGEVNYWRRDKWSSWTLQDIGFVLGTQGWEGSFQHNVTHHTILILTSGGYSFTYYNWLKQQSAALQFCCREGCCEK